MSISVEATCPTHGSGVEIFTVGGRRFCAACVSDYLGEKCSDIKMVTTDNDPPKISTRKAIEGSEWERKRGGFVR